jgi:hypothetical protein
MMHPNSNVLAAPLSNRILFTNSKKGGCFCTTYSLDKVTSVFIHISPCIALYTVRWLYPDPDHTRFPSLKTLDTLPTTQSLIAAICLYLTWQVLYYVLVVVRQKEKIKAGKRVTSYTWLLDDDKGGNISKVAHTFGEKYSIVTFMGMQLLYTVRVHGPSCSCFCSAPITTHILLTVSFY